MDYVRLKNTDETISVITLGTWAMGGNHWSGCDESKALKAIETAVDNGINAIDTAPVYGDGRAEELVGKAIHGRRDKVFLATKCGLDIRTRKYERDLSPSYIELDLNESLRRLRTDHIDLYQCHWPDGRTPIEETMAALLRFREEGKIRYIGVSNFNGEELRGALRCGPVFSMQAHYSLLERGIERDVLGICREGGINVLSYGSLGAGMLTGKYCEQPSFGRGDARSFFYRFFKPRYWPRVRLLIDGVEHIAAAKGTKPGAIALSWLLRQEDVVSVIVGARSPEQVLDNVMDIPQSLDNEDMFFLDNLSKDIYAD